MTQFGKIFCDSGCDRRGGVPQIPNGSSRLLLRQREWPNGCQHLQEQTGFTRYQMFEQQQGGGWRITPRASTPSQIAATALCTRYILLILPLPLLVYFHLANGSMDDTERQCQCRGDDLVGVSDISRLRLSTCHPGNSRRERIVVEWW